MESLLEVSQVEDYITLKTEGCYLNIPEPELRAVIRSTGDQVGVIGTPS